MLFPVISMFRVFVSGKYIRKRKLGFVADYCANCREPQPFKLFEILSYQYIFLIPIPLAALVGHEMRCTKCKWTSFVDSQRYSSFLVNHDVSIDLLIQQTLPQLWDFLEDRERQAIRIERGESTPQERAALFAEVCFVYEKEVKKRASEMMFDDAAGVTMFGMVALPLATWVCLNALGWRGTTTPYILAAQDILLFIYLIYLVATDVRRYCRRVVFPKLTPKLASFQLTEQDIEAGLKQLKREGMVIGSKIRAADLHADLQYFLRSNPSNR